jgi:membrane dipeptidase
MCQLTYNASDEVGTGWTDPVDRGLSPFGEEVVARLNELGIVVCVSHTSHRTTLDACRRSTAPVVASHSFAQGRHAHARGRSDDAIRAIADTGGVVGVCAIPHFLAPGPGATIEALLGHVEYIADLVGWRHVAIGTDWPMQAPKAVLRRVFGAWFPGEAETTDFTATLVGFDGYEDLPNVTRGLVRRGWGDEAICGLLGGNALRVLEAVWG